MKSKIIAGNRPSDGAGIPSVTDGFFAPQGWGKQSCPEPYFADFKLPRVAEQHNALTDLILNRRLSNKGIFLPKNERTVWQRNMELWT